MEPKNIEYGPGTELPHLGDIGDYAHAPEQTAATPETLGQQSPAITGLPPALPVSNIPGSSINDLSLGSAASTNSSISTGLIADDADLIEKEWVLKAKAIVMQTKADPRAQNIQMNGIKADYLKKRYNKDLKVNEI